MKKYKVTSLPRAAQFRHYIYQLIDAPLGYEWGKETPWGTDCSGTVCYPLIRMGFKIRTTADDLYKRVFTINVPDSKLQDLSRVMVVFYIATKPWTKLSGEKMPAGSARHVTPVVGRYVVCQANWKQDKIYLDTAYNVRVNMEPGCEAVWREIDWKATRLLSGKAYYGPDSELIQWLDMEV